jgi:hypothetical protein
MQKRRSRRIRLLGSNLPTGAFPLAFTYRLRAAHPAVASNQLGAGSAVMRCSTAVRPRPPGLSARNLKQAKELVRGVAST